MSLTDRVKSPTPPWFQKLRTIGLILAGASVAILTSPVSLPAIVVTVAGYAAVAGGVISAVSQTAISEEE